MADENHSLFRPAPLKVDLEATEGEDTTSPAYQELLAEVDRAMSGYERAAKTNAWLAEAGLNAEARLAAEAESAKASGERLSAVDLLTFVREAVEVDAGRPDAVAEGPDGTWTLRLPPAWAFGLDDLPGYEAETRTLRLTTDRARLTDAEGRSVGFLGRAHPVVRRALDRVRNIQFGGADALLDPRASAAISNTGEPTLLFTFLGAVRSGAGTEFERVLAVQVAREGTPEVFTDPAAWESLADRRRQVPTAGVWERHFASWRMDRRADALAAAAAAFRHSAEDFLQAHAEQLAEERAQLDRWLESRAADLCGAPEPQRALPFGDDAAPPSAWKVLTAPSERLAAFATDAGNPAARRREAEGVLSLHRARLTDLDRRSEPQVLAPAPLGLLMLVPG